jgi:hypothetical protein
MDELGIRAFRPTPWRFILLARKNAHGHRNGDALGIEKTTLVFPIETRCRGPRVCQPIERDVVEDLITRQFAGGARSSVQRRGDRRGGLAIRIIVVESQAAKPMGESATPYKVCGRAAIILAYSTCLNVRANCSHARCSSAERPAGAGSPRLSASLMLLGTVAGILVWIASTDFALTNVLIEPLEQSRHCSTHHLR